MRRNWVIRWSVPAVFEDATHHPAVRAASSSKLQHTVVDVVRRPLVVLVRPQVLLGHMQDAEVASAHLQSFLQPVARLHAHTDRQ